MNRVGLIIISTGKYDIFIQPLIESADKFFFRGESFDIYLLSDKEYLNDIPERITLTRFSVPHMKFPFPTLFRYKWITEYAQSMTSENLYYLDVDMLFVDEVGSEILPDGTGLVATRHPGFHVSNGWGDNATHNLSTAYLKPSLRHSYYAGGFQGGSREEFLTASQMMSECIGIDLDTAEHMGYTQNNGVLAKWADESHWNWHCKMFPPSKILTPSYCMVEEIELRKKWGIDNLTPRIIALKKDHAKLRT